MKLRRIIYLTIIAIIVIQTYQRIIYSFETNNKIITHSTFEIGPKGQSYKLPSLIGSSNQILKLNQNKELVWVDGLPPEPIMGPYEIEPFFKTVDKCPNGTCFVPLEPGGLHRGYCVITNDHSANPSSCTTNQWNGVLSIPLETSVTGFYCQQTYGLDAFLPPQRFYYPHLEQTGSTAIPANRFRNKYTYDENQTIAAFINAIKFQSYTAWGFHTMASSMINYYRVGNVQPKMMSFIEVRPTPFYILWYDPCSTITNSSSNVLCIR